MFNVCEMIDENRKYYIYGTTAMGRYCYNMITKRYGENLVLGFVQTMPQREICMGKRVYNVQQAIEQTKNSTDSIVFILASLKRADEMKNNLLEHGISEDSMFSMEQYGFIIQYIPEKQVKNILLWPPIETRNTDLSVKIKWFVPDKINIGICSSNHEVMSDFADAENIEFVDSEEIEEKLETSDYIAVWDTETADLRIETYRHKVHVIDPNFYHVTELTNYRFLYYSGFSEEEKEEFRKHSLEVFKKMKKEYSGVERANVFCTGPSIEEIEGNSYRGDFNVICNSMVKDKEFLENIKPSMLTFGDLAFYLSPNDYCKAFYKDLLETYEKYNYYIAVYDYEVPLIKKYFPMLYDRLIGVKQSGAYNFPNDSEVRVRGTANICTLFMIPFASAVCDKIGIAGCTGRDPEEKYFWKHNGRCQYLDLMHCVFEAYPSFFKYENYEDYYNVHCQCMQDLIEYGEQNGKKYINLTTSFIPVLQERRE